MGIKKVTALASAGALAAVDTNQLAAKKDIKPPPNEGAFSLRFRIHITRV